MAHVTALEHEEWEELCAHVRQLGGVSATYHLLQSRGLASSF
jgi:hypothetical protein